MLGELPAILALDAVQEGREIAADAGADFGPVEVAANAGMERIQAGPPVMHILIAPRGALLGF